MSIAGYLLKNRRRTKNLGESGMRIRRRIFLEESWTACGANLCWFSELWHEYHWAAVTLRCAACLTTLTTLTTDHWPAISLPAAVCDLPWPRDMTQICGDVDVFDDVTSVPGLSEKSPIQVAICLWRDQNPLHTFPRNFPVHGKVTNLATSRCNGIWETTRHNRHNGLFARENLLQTCYGETGVMEFRLKGVATSVFIAIRHRQSFMLILT